MEECHWKKRKERLNERGGETMKFVKETPKYGTKRTRTKFLWWPMTIATRMSTKIDVFEEGDYRHEKRWLEIASWEEEWTLGFPRDFWKPVKFLDRREGQRRQPLVGADE